MPLSSLNVVAKYKKWAEKTLFFLYGREGVEWVASLPKKKFWIEITIKLNFKKYIQPTKSFFNKRKSL